MMGTAPCANASNRRRELGVSPEIMRQNSSDCCSRCEYSDERVAFWRESAHLPRMIHTVSLLTVAHCHDTASTQCTAAPLARCVTERARDPALNLKLTAWHTVNRTSTDAGASTGARRGTRKRGSRGPGRVGCAPRQVEARRHRAALGEEQVVHLLACAHESHVVLRQWNDFLGHLSSEVVGRARVQVACGARRELRELSCMPPGRVQRPCSGAYMPVPMNKAPLSRERLFPSCAACLPVGGATALCRYGTEIVQRQVRSPPWCSAVSKCAMVMLVSACSLPQHCSVLWQSERARAVLGSACGRGKGASS